MKKIFLKTLTVCKVFCLLVVLLPSCKKGEPITDLTDPQAPHNFSGLNMDEDVALCVSFDMTTSTFISPKNSEDNELITQAEQIMAIPIPMGCRVKQMIKNDGTVDADIEMVQFEGMPQFPKNMIGNITFPEKFMTKRIEVRNGASTHYNASDEVILTSFQSIAEIEFLENLVSEIGEDINSNLTAEQMDIAIQGFKDAGFNVVQDNNYPNIEYLTQQFNDGSSTKVILDKELEVIRGRFNYDASGKLSVSSQFIYSDNPAGVKELSGHWFSTFYESPFSEVTMSINKVSQITNFSIQKNN